jgi:lipopolysaccharide export system protein LptC
MTPADHPPGQAAPLVDSAPTGRAASPSVPRRHRPRLSRFVAASMRRRRHNAFYSRFVTLMKVVLPATALALAALVLFWPQLNPLDNRFRLKPVQVSVDDLENLRMVSPRFVGVDARNQPFSITAEQATQDAGGSDVTDLTSPKGDITIANGSWIALTADTGQYFKQARVLDLNDHVNVFHDAGYEIKTAHAKADLAKGDVYGDDPVDGQGPDSQLRGQGFRIYDKGARIAITGKSRLLVFPKPPEPK